MLAAVAMVGALLGVDSGRVVALDPATLRPVGGGAKVGRLLGPVAWSPSRRQVAVAVRPAGRVEIPGGRSFDTGVRTAWLAWGRTRLFSVSSDGRIAIVNPSTGRVVARSRIKGRIVDVQAAGEKLVVLLEGSLVALSPRERRPGSRSTTTAMRIVPLPGVARGGLAVSPDRAYVAAPGGVTEVPLASGEVVRHPLARAAKDTRPWRSATLIGDTLAVSGCDERSADHRGCARPYGLRLISTRTWNARTIDSRAAAFKRTGDMLVLDAAAYGEGRRLGLRAYSSTGALRVRAFAGADILAQVGASHAYAHRIGFPGSATHAIDLRTGADRLLPARVPYLL